MFRRKSKKKKKKDSSLSEEEKKKIIENAKGKMKKKKKPKKKVEKVEEEPEPQEVVQKKEKDLTYTDYFIGKRQVIKEQKTIETKSGQIIQLPEKTERTIVNDIYQLTQEDLVAILQGVDTDEIISELALRMLTGEL